MPVANTNVYSEPNVEGVVSITTRKGDVFLIDADDVDLAKRHCWSRHEHGYARAVTRIAGGRMKTVYLHRLICATDLERPHVDHINGIQSDCRRANLRACNRSQNLSNQRIRSDSRTNLKGVGLHKQTGKFRARVRSMGEVHNLGLFESPESAAASAKEARERIHGRFARHA